MSLSSVSESLIASILFQLDEFDTERRGRNEALIPEDMTFIAWCRKLAEKGLKVDGKPFTLDNRPALVPIYEAIPTTREEAHGRVLVIQKATQLGLTVWEVLAVLYMAAKWEPVTIGMFLPDQATAAYKSEHRFMRMVRSAPELYDLLLSKPTEEATRRSSEGNILTRTLRESILLFLWTSGKVTTESRPMDVVTLDEVQEMQLDQIDKVMARLGDSDIAFVLLLSTANMPDADINFWYQQGDQRVWHTRCPHCHALSDLSDPGGIFPGKSIRYEPEAREYVYTCPQCAGVITDAQAGEYIALKPKADSKITSYLLPRTISPKMTPRDMYERWKRAKTGHQKKSYYNRTLARPYIDADQLPVTMAHCEAAAQAGMAMGLVWETRGQGYYMGIDQMGGFLAIIIKKRLRDGRQAVAHVEAAFANPTPDDPNASTWDRADELMSLYGIAMCVVEQLPNVDEARKFANRHPGKVFLAGYADMKDDMIVWGDDMSKSDSKTVKEDRSRYAVTLHQYKAMQASLFRIRDLGCLFPDPDALTQDVQDGGEIRHIPILREWVFVHFTKIALVIEEEGDEASSRRKGRTGTIARKTRAKVMKVGIDPHYSFANMLCDVAWSRSHGMGTIMIPQTSDTETPPANTIQSAAVASTSPLPVSLETPEKHTNTCGACSNFNKHQSLCQLRSFHVEPRDASCEWFA